MTLLLVQMAIVLSLSLACGAVARRLGQARVIGEMIAGILIGPSVLGRLAPDTTTLLFPQSSLRSFEVLSTTGLILFLFLIGSELNYRHLHEQRLTATMVSLMSMLLPFGMALAAAPLLHARFAPAGVSGTVFALFFGISLSITAFPVLARILEEHGMQRTRLGVTAILCAAVDDVTAWLLLAVALTLLPHEGSSIPFSHRLLWLSAYLGTMVFAVRPMAQRLTQRVTQATLSYGMLGAIFVFVFVSATATEAIGIHPLFGAFMAGLCFPRVAAWQETLRAKLDVIVSLLLLPFFFALTGMRTRFDLLSGPAEWLWTLVILLLAISGKVGGAMLGARVSGYEWRDAGMLGVLLNTRGLVELVVLSIAYQAGVFPATLFSMLVVMALVTTMMTTPLLRWLRVGGVDAEISLQ